MIIKREPHEDLYAAIRNSFDAAYRNLEDFVRQQRGDVKGHEEVALARVSILFPDKGYGFLHTPDCAKSTSISTASSTINSTV